MSLIKLNPKNYTPYSCKDEPSIYHTFRAGNLVTYKDTNDKIHCDVILATFEDGNIRIMTDGIIPYYKLRHADLYELIEYGCPNLLEEKKSTETNITMSCQDARKLLSNQETILKSIKLINNTTIKITIYN